MNEELLKNIWEHLSKNNLTKSDFSTWKNNVEGSDDVQLNIYSYLSDNKLTESSLDQWKENLGLKKKDEEQVLESVSKPTQEDITLDTEKVQEVTPSDSLVGEGMCPPGQVKHPQTGKCVNLSVLEVTPISGVQQPITMGEVVKYDQNEETGEIIYPKSFKGERPRCKVGFAWNGSYCQRIEEVQESFNKLSPSGKEEYLKQIDADEKTAKEMFNISFQEKAPEDLTTEEKNKYQEQESLYKEEVPKTDQELAAQKVKDRVNKSLKEELDIDLPYVIDEFITDVNYDRPPTEMLTNQLPTVGPGGEQVIYTGPSTIGEMIVNADEEKAEVALSEIYGGWGFTFEQTGLGDAIIVTSNAQEDLNRSTLKNMTSSEQQDYKLKNGISVEIDLQSFTEKGSKEEAEKLKNFIDSNYYRPELYDKDAPDDEFPKGYVESTLDDIYQAAKKGDTKQFRRIYNEDVIDAEINQLRELDKDLTTSIPQFEQDVKQYNESFNAYDQELSNFQTKLNSFNQRVESFTGLVKDGKVSEVEAQNFYAQAAKEEELLLNEQKRLLAMEQPLKDQGKSLQDQYKVIEEKKSKITAFEPKLQTIAAEQASYLATQGTIGGSLWGSFLGAIDSRNTAMASFGVDLMGMIQKNLLDEGQWESNAKVVGQDKSGNPVYETKDQYYNRIRKEVKQDIVPYIKDVYKDAFGTDVTNEYQQKFQETTFGAVTTSLSQLLAHGVTTLGNPTAIGVSFGGQIYGDLTTEMMDEKYDDMTENEKMAVAGSVALVSGILEKYGFSKLFPGAGKISQTVLTRALGRIKGKATYETIEEAIEMEVKSLPKAFFRTGNAMLIEGGVEGTQAAAEMGIKGIYNTLKEKEVFEDADILSKQGLGRIVNDAYVGALAGGSIGSVNAGIQAYRENVMDKLNRNQFESVKLFATDPKFRDIYFYQLQGEIQDKTLTPEDAKKKWADLNNMVSLFEQVNGLDLNSEQQQEAFTLLNEKQKLNKQIAGKDESLIKPQRDRIKAIDTRLSRISEDVQKEITVEIAEEVTAEAAPEVTEEVDIKTETVDDQGRPAKAGARLFNEPNPETAEISAKYKQDKGIEISAGENITELDIDNAMEIADAYEAMEDNPSDPEVQEAYNALAKETVDQYNAMTEAGYEIEIYDGKGEPYANSQEMIDDLKNNKHMYIFSTEVGFGDAGITDQQRKENAMLQDSGFKDKNGKPLLINDLFRGVHDFFGHSERGNGFGAKGEENAWDVHARMFTDKARRAMTTETRGQNSWVNFGPQMRNEKGEIIKKGEPGYLGPRERAFAPQKMGLLPESYSEITETPTIEITEETLSEGKAEMESVKEGTTTTTKPVKIFKGIGGKKDLKGSRINAHEGVEGVFSSVDEEVAAEYGKEEGVAEVVLPEGTTVEVVEIDGTGMSPSQYRQAEVEAINNSDAQVVKLITIDGVMKKGAKKQEQYIIKDESLIKEIKKPREEVAEEVVEDKPSKERVDRIVNEIINKVKKRNFGKDVNPKVILKAVTGYLKGSKFYSQANDIERENAVREINEKLGIKIPKAPSISKVLSKPKRKKIVVDEVAALKDQIRLEARAARGAVKAYKDISKSIIEDVKKLSKKGVITPSQSSAIIKKVLSTNMMNPKMVDRLTEYIDKVYKKAELAEKIAKSRNKLKQAKTNLKSKVGASPELQNVLDELFSIDPSLIPLDKFDSYFEIIERFGARKAVLDLPEAGEVMSQATDIINSVETNIEEEVKDPVSKEKNKEIEDNLDSYIADIISEKINTENLYNQEGKDIADYLSKLTKEDLLSLVKEKKDGTKDYSDLEKLKLVKNNMSNGFVPKMSMDLKIKVESNRSSKEINDVTSKIKETSLLTGFSRIYGSLKGLVTGKSKMTESVRGTATFYIDDIFGNFNSKTIWNNTFGRLAKSYSKYESDLAKNVTSKLDAAEVLLSKTKIPTIQRQRNDIQRSKVKIMAYRLQREFESNPGNKQVASANSFIEETIKAMERREANSRLNKQEIKILKEIQNKFLVDGEISLDKIEKSFTNNEKKALDLIDEIGVYLEPKAVFTSSVIRGGKIKPINNYVHHSVMNKDKVEDVNNKKDRMVKPSTKAGTLRERTPGAKPINFDPISSTLSGATETLLDYHMTETVKTVNASIKKAKDQIYDNEDSSNISKEAIVALEESVDEVMSKTFSNSFVEYDPFSKTIKKLQKLGYQAALASVPRAGAELGSNMLFAISSNPQGFISGVKKYSGFAMGNEGMNAMENLGSTETMKLYDTKNMTGKMADSNVLYTGKPKASKAVSPVVEKAEYLSQFSGVKQVRKFADELSDKLISTPDKAVSRPLWFGNFSSNFKKMTGITLTEKDFIEIADGSSKYLSKEYKQAVEESTKFADQESVKMATSSNPFNVIPKNISTPDEAVYKQIYKNANSYMARFSQYEYATARNAIVSLFKAGKLTKKQALGTLIGTQMRMASYMILYSSLRSAFDRLFGFKDEEEEDYKTMIKRQLVGSPLSLLTGRGLGNVPKIAINYGLELFNEKYLEDLRDGKKYDPYKHSLVFSQISPGDKRDPYEIFLNTMTGPLSPLAKTAARTYKVYTKSKESKKAETRAKYKEELSTRMLLEGLGNLGFIPFYKDIRRMFLKDFFKDYKKEQKAKEEKKEKKKQYDESMTKYIKQRDLKIKSTTEKVIKETPIE